MVLSGLRTLAQTAHPCATCWWGPTFSLHWALSPDTLSVIISISHAVSCPIKCLMITGCYCGQLDRSPSSLCPRMLLLPQLPKLEDSVS